MTVVEPFEYNILEAIRCHGCGRRFQMSLTDIEVMDYKSHFCSRCQKFHFYANSEEKAQP